MSYNYEIIIFNKNDEQPENLKNILSVYYKIFLYFKFFKRNVHSKFYILSAIEKLFNRKYCHLWKFFFLDFLFNLVKYDLFDKCRVLIFIFII